MLLQIGDLSADSHGAEGGLSTDVRIGRGNEVFDFGKQVSRHFDGGDVAQGAEGEANDVLI